MKLITACLVLGVLGSGEAYTNLADGSTFPVTSTLNCERPRQPPIIVDIQPGDLSIAWLPLESG